ncbi:MAG: DUF928 domain-containing protein [Cyanobacteria bacterium J06635_15]
MIKQFLIKISVCLLIINPLTAKAWADYTGDTTADDSAPRSSTISTAPRYFQPLDPSAPRTPGTTTGTRRGGCFDSEVSPVILAPYGFVGRTAENRPVFTWFLPDDDPVPVEFSLYSLQTSGSVELQHSGTLAYEAGLTRYQLPSGAVLEANQTYLWQVVLHCNPNRPSTALVYEAEIEFMPMSEALTQTLGTETVAAERSRIFAEAGYWYDAIAAVGTSQMPDALEMRSVLINDLALLEEAVEHNDDDRARKSIVHSENLRQLNAMPTP